MKSQWSVTLGCLATLGSCAAAQGGITLKAEHHVFAYTRGAGSIYWQPLTAADLRNLVGGAGTELSFTIHTPPGHRLVLKWMRPAGRGPLAFGRVATFPPPRGQEEQTNHEGVRGSVIEYRCSVTIPAATRPDMYKAQLVLSRDGSQAVDPLPEIPVPVWSSGLVTAVRDSTNIPAGWVGDAIVKLGSLAFHNTSNHALLLREVSITDSEGLLVERAPVHCGPDCNPILSPNEDRFSTGDIGVPCRPLHLPEYVRTLLVGLPDRSTLRVSAVTYSYISKDRFPIPFSPVTQSLSPPVPVQFVMRFNPWCAFALALLGGILGNGIRRAFLMGKRKPPRWAADVFASSILVMGALLSIDYGLARLFGLPTTLKFSHSKPAAAVVLGLCLALIDPRLLAEKIAKKLGG